ncbi:MAG: hypothetical protein KGS61_04195 [Verrucomicrobia bacterium]|nr:hypothetical protein [Verrucomicrobiota bacterium]
MALVLLAVAPGCADFGIYGDAGPGWIGPDYDDYFGPGYYGPVWGPDVFVFGHDYHGGFDRNFGRRGFGSRMAGPGVRGGGFGHFGGGFRGGGFHGGGFGHGGGRGR